MTAFHQIWALVLVQYRSLWNTLRGEGGRLRLTGSILFGVFWYGAWTLATIGVAAIPNLIGREDIENALGGILLFALAYWQLAPLMTLSLGVSLEMSRVSIYPVSSLTLFSAECLLRLGTGAEIVLLLSGLIRGAGHSRLTSQRGFGRRLSALHCVQRVSLGGHSQSHRAVVPASSSA